MIIRSATLNDIPHIMQIIGEVVPGMIASGNLQWDHNYPNATVFERDIELGQLWVAEIDGSIAGMAAHTADAEPEYAAAGIDVNIPAIVTHRIAVSPRYRGLGIAGALLLKAEDVAIDKGINVLRVDTNSNNQATQKLFPALGYKYAGEIGLAFRPGLNFYCYEKVLIPKSLKSQ